MQITINGTGLVQRADTDVVAAHAHSAYSDGFKGYWIAEHPTGDQQHDDRLTRADHGGVGRAAVVQHDLNCVRVGDHVIVGKNVALFRYDYAGAEGALYSLLSGSRPPGSAEQLPRIGRAI